MENETHPKPRFFPESTLQKIYQEARLGFRRLRRMTFPGAPVVVAIYFAPDLPVIFPIRIYIFGKRDQFLGEGKDPGGPIHGSRTAQSTWRFSRFFRRFFF